MKKIILTLSFILLATTLSAQEKYTLKNRFPEGTYTLTQTTSMDMTINMEAEEGFSQKMPMKQHQTQEIKIVAGPTEADGTQKVSMEIVRMAVEAETMGVTMKYDSADDSQQNAESPMSMVGFVVGLKLTMTYDKDGKVTKVEGLDEFWEKAAKDAPLAMRAMIKELKKSMNSETYTKMLDVNKEDMPPKSVAVGESWQVEAEAELPIIGKMHVQKTNTLESVETVDGVEIATIRSVGTLTAADGQTIKIGPGEVTIKEMNIDVDTVGKMEVKTGVPVSTESKIKQTMTAETVGTGDFGSKNMKMTMENAAETRVTITRE